MRRVVILSRGGAGKSTAARQLGQHTGLPVIELDEIFWQPDLTATPRAKWIEAQRELGAADRWIMDGDLGPYDALAERLIRADTVLILGFSLVCCAWRALRRSRERVDFLVVAIDLTPPQPTRAPDRSSRLAPTATTYRLRRPGSCTEFLCAVSARHQRGATWS